MHAIVIVDHGSRLADANAAVVGIARAVQAERPDALVRHAHLGHAEPDVPTTLAACAAEGATHVTVVPYFLAAGRHVTEDIPRLAAEAAAAHGLTIEVRPPLGPHPLLAQLVLQRAAG